METEDIYDESVVSATFNSWHSSADPDITYIPPADNDKVDEVPLFGAGMHPRDCELAGHSERMLVIVRSFSAHIVSNTSLLPVTFSSPCGTITPSQLLQSLPTLPLKSPSMTILSLASVDFTMDSTFSTNAYFFHRYWSRWEHRD